MNTAHAFLSFRQFLLAPLVTLRMLLLLPVMATAWLLLRRSSDPAPVATAADPLHSDEADLEFSVVIPFYNPGDALRPTVQGVVDILRQRETSFEVIAVSDGSSDGSELTLAGIGPEVRVIEAPHNMGKGAALHRGFAQARGAHIGFIDADGDIDPIHLADYLDRAQAHGHDVVYASKRHTDSISQASTTRKVISAGFITLMKTLFALPVADTQTGCKVFSRHALATTLPQLREHRFAFDLEFFVAARSAGITDMAAAPVELKERLAGSTVSRSTILRTLTDAITVFARLHLTRRYWHTTFTAAIPAATPAPAPALATVHTLPTREAPSTPQLAAA